LRKAVQKGRPQPTVAAWNHQSRRSYFDSPEFELPLVPISEDPLLEDGFCVLPFLLLECPLFPFPFPFFFGVAVWSLEAWLLVEVLLPIELDWPLDCSD